MSTTIKQSAYEEIRKEFEDVKAKVWDIQSDFEKQVFVGVGMTVEEARKQEFSFRIAEIKPQIQELKYGLNFIIKRTNTTDIEDYVQFLDNAIDFEYDLDKITEKMNEE